MAEDVFPEYINMISLNLFRAVAPPDDPKAAYVARFYEEFLLEECYWDLRLCSA
jgi:hypothetical protein